MTRQLRAGVLRLSGLFNRERRDRELAEELESHVALHVEDNLRAGMTPEAARRDALLKLGGVEAIKEQVRDRRGVPGLEHLARDLRFGARMLRKDPGFTAIAVLTLALGIGANTAIFSVVNAVLLRPLPFPEADRLVLVWATNTESGRMDDVVSYPDFEAWKARSRSFENMAAFTTRGMVLTGGDQAEAVAAVQATPGFFETLKAHPALGRTFRPEESEAGASHVALLSDGTWKSRFAGRADVVGQTIRANEETYTIIGVMPPTFRFSPEKPEQIYVPLVRDPNRNHGFLRILGRLRPRAGVATAQAEMDVITRGLAKEYPKTNEGVGARVVPALTAMVGKTRTGLLIFLGVVAIVLVIACTNVAGLMSARSASRQKELTVRAALGAGRKRLLQQLLTESTVLALAGGLLGLLLASWGTRLLVALLARSFPIPRIETTHIDGWVLLFTLALSLITGILFGSVLAVPAASPDLNEVLRESGRTATEGIGGRRARSMLVIAEVSLALILLSGAGLLLKSLLVLRNTAPGFATENLLTVYFEVPKSKLGTAAERSGFFASVLARVANLPGMRSAALVADLPLGGSSDSMGFHIVGRPDPASDGGFSASFNIASAGYFRTMSIPVRAGREFTDQDSANAPGVIVVNETAARTFWPGESALGKQITLRGGGGSDGKDGNPLTVVGVTGDVRQSSLGRAPQPEIFLNSAQPGPPWPLDLVMRTAGDPAALTEAIRSMAQSIDRDVPVSQVRTMDDILSGTLAQPRVYTLLLLFFAALALALAAVGLYGVVSYTVTQRMHEMGIRMALGAERGDVVWLVLRQGLSLTLTGTVIGLAGALAVTRILTKLLPGVQPGDPLTLTVVALLLIGVALAASYLPARRGSRVDPVVTLRYE
ncbi:MAG TPA: ABC transporter permease [Thermoanaerobaculia bacterium]|jgi:putative ABC transport system permease protein|nr:ABC transporter permease [Thermoanaerobaculia bacterium]